MTKNSVGIYIDSEKPDDIYSLVEEYFKDYIDMVIFSDVPSSCKNIQRSVLPSFYMYFFNHPIVFLDTKYIDSMKSKIMSENIYVLKNGEIQKYEI